MSLSQQIMACVKSGVCGGLLTSKKPLILQFVRKRSFIQKMLVSREECLKMSRTSKADYQSILEKLSLSEQWPGFQGTSAEVQLLRHNFSKLDHLYIRPGNSFPTYHRIELIMQRLRYMSKMGLTPKEKLNSIKKNPPVLIIAQKQFLDSSEVVYLRGILNEGLNHRYLFYPVFPRVCTKRAELDERLQHLAASLAATKQQILQTALSIPCFSINSNFLSHYKELMVLLHLKMLPENFDLDTDTLDIHPPTFHKKMQHCLAYYQEHNEVPHLEGVKFSDVLDLQYSNSNGQGCAEDVVEFLLRAHNEEFQYKPPVNFKQKKLPRKHKRFHNLSVFSNLLDA